ncbi:MAG: hypothetical protein JNM17_00220 [Archangium sp.]|nr:hypothetical protein [Archangium sp.]
MTKKLLFLAALVPSLAFAAPSARLLSPDDAPAKTEATAPSLADAASNVSSDIGLGELFVKTSAVAVAASATGIVLGAGLGALSNNLIGAAIPGLLIANLIFPPLITVLSAALMGNWNTKDRFGFWLPLGAAFLVNAAAVVITGLFINVAVGITNPLSMLVFCTLDGLLMSGATVGVMALTEKKKVTTVKSFAPGVTDSTFVVLNEVAF